MPIVPVVQAAEACVTRSTPKTSSRIAAGDGDRSGQVDAPPGRGPGAATSGRAAARRPGCSEERMTGAKNTQRQSIGGEQAADDQAEGEAAAPRCRSRRAAPCCAAAPREAGGDDRQAGRGHEGGGDPGHEPGEDQHPAFGGQPAEAGEEQEHHEPEDEHPPAAEQVGRPAAQQHEAAVAEDVGAHRPTAAAGGQAEVGADRRAAPRSASPRRCPRGRSRRTARTARPRRGRSSGREVGRWRGEWWTAGSVEEAPDRLPKCWSVLSCNRLEACGTHGEPWKKAL